MRTCVPTGPTLALLLMHVCKPRMPRHSLAERNLRVEDNAGDTVLALQSHNLDLPRQTPYAKDRTDLTGANFANILEVSQGLTTMPQVSSYMSSKTHVYLDPLTSVPVEDRLALV
jgi:hypothetical protein